MCPSNSSQAWVASGRANDRFLIAAQLNIDSQLGSNPQSASFITGVLTSPFHLLALEPFLKLLPHFYGFLLTKAL